MFNEDIKARDVVIIRHPFLFHHPWKVTQVLPSIHGDQLLYRVQLLNKSGEIDTRFKGIVITREFIRENLGGYDKWLETLKENYKY